MPFWVVTTTVLSWNRAGYLLRDGFDLVRLERQDHHVLLAGLGDWLVALTFSPRARPPSSGSASAVFLHGLEMRAARDQRDFLAREREFAPIKPPMAPAPTMQIFMSISSAFVGTPDEMKFVLRQAQDERFV